MHACTAIQLPIYRPAFGHILKYCQFCNHPVMALTAIATPPVQQDIANYLKNPVQSIASINQSNIFYSCYELELQSQGMDITFEQ